MVYNAERHVWEGNRQALKAFDRPEPSRIGLVTNLGRANVPQVRHECPAARRAYYKTPLPLLTQIYYSCMPMFSLARRSATWCTIPTSWSGTGTRPMLRVSAGWTWHRRLQQRPLPPVRFVFLHTHTPGTSDDHGHHRHVLVMH